MFFEASWFVCGSIRRRSGIGLASYAFVGKYRMIHDIISAAAFRVVPHGSVSNIVRGDGYTATRGSMRLGGGSGDQVKVASQRPRSHLIHVFEASWHRAYKGKPSHSIVIRLVD
jgi:hypothetical protein